MTLHSHSQVPTRGMSFLHIGYISASAASMGVDAARVPFYIALIIGLVFIRVKDEMYQFGGLCALGLALLFGLFTFLL